MAGPYPDSGPLIAVAPLDWGLGHATRCIPLIRQLLLSHARVLLLGSGSSLHLLRQHFPDLPAEELPAYALRYGAGAAWSILSQLPRLQRVIEAERLAFHKLIEKYGIRAVISDNRYGIHHLGIPSIFLGHQLSPIPPRPFGIFSNGLARIHGRFLSRFNACWIPDRPGLHNLSGRLSQSPVPGMTSRFVGRLSRFDAVGSGEMPCTLPGNFEPDVLTILSGPEPARSKFEQLIIRQAATIPERICILRGKPEEEQIHHKDNLLSLPQLPDLLFSFLLQKTPLVISRPGYSSLMDYEALGLRRVVLVPTPGQTEQLYLGTRMQKQGKAQVLRQGSFSLRAALQLPGPARGFGEEKPDELLCTAVNALLGQLKS